MSTAKFTSSSVFPFHELDCTSHHGPRNEAGMQGDAQPRIILKVHPLRRRQKRCWKIPSSTPHLPPGTDPARQELINNNQLGGCSTCTWACCLLRTQGLKREAEVLLEAPSSPQIEHLLPPALPSQGAIGAALVKSVLKKNQTVSGMGVWHIYRDRPCPV